MPKVSTNISLDPTLKKEAQELLADFGMDLSTAITIFLKQTVREQKIPFTISRSVPKPETVAAFDEAEDILRHPDRYPSYHSFHEIMNDVFADEV